MPRNTNMPPRVTIIEGTRKRTVNTPYSSPMAQAAARAEIAEGTTPRPNSSMNPMNTTPATAKTDPTDRSISPLVIRSACPIAITPTTAVTRSTLGMEFSQTPSVPTTKNAAMRRAPMTTPASTRRRAKRRTEARTPPRAA